MKTKLLFTTLILITIFCSKNVFSQQNWVQVNSGTTNTLSSIWFTNNMLGWAVGGNGTILHSTDGGNNWYQQTSSFTDYIYDICFVNDNVGWISTGKCIRKTTDGGVSWEIQYQHTEWMRSVHFINESVGWAVGDGTFIIHTTDGGQNWSVQNTGYTGNASMTDVYFLDADTGYISSWGASVDVSFKTYDGGINWQQLSIVYTCPAYSVHAVNGRKAFIVGKYDFMYYYTTWPSYAHCGISAYKYSVFFSDENTGWIVGDSGYVSLTTDGGSNWVLQNSSTGNKLLDVYFRDSSHGWIVGYNGTILKYNGGSSVEQYENKKDIIELYPNPTTGIVKIKNEELKIKNISVFDIYGREVLKTEVGSSSNSEALEGGQETEVDLYSQPKGIYIIKVQTEKGNFVDKVIVN